MLLSIQNALEKRSWYQNSSGEMKGKLHDLCESGYAGFVGYLSNFSDQYDKDTEILRLEHIAKAKYSLVAPVFAIRKDGKEFTYEFASWKMGPDSGAKGVLFLEDATGTVTHFVLLRAKKFALAGEEVYDCIGGFVEEGKDLSVQDNILREISEEVDSTLTDLRIENLGKIYVDHGMSCNHPTIFAAFAKTQITPNWKNLDCYEVSSRVLVTPIADLGKIIEENDDALFLATIMRAKTRNLI